MHRDQMRGGIVTLKMPTMTAQPVGPAAVRSERYARKLSPQEIDQLPVMRWEGRIHLVNRQEEIAPAIEGLLREEVVGFDTETRPAFRKGVSYRPSLLQLAGSESVWIFQLSRFHSFEPLDQLLGAAKVLKVGVGLDQDIKQLLDLFPFLPDGFCDLGEIAREQGLESRGLRSMAASFLDYRISKSAQCSNWGKETLQPFQITYAATDAWISREIYQFLLRMNLVERDCGFNFGRQESAGRERD